MENFMTDKKMDFSRMLFHGLHFGCSDEAEDLEQMVLDKILMYGEILPKERLREVLTEEEFWKVYMTKNTLNWNSDDCVSLAQQEDTYNGLNSYAVCRNDYAFYIYCSKHTSLIISREILEDFNSECYGINKLHKDRKNNFMNGEIQVKRSVPKGYFRGISYYQCYHNSYIEKLIHEGKLNCEVINDLLKLTEDDWLKKYYSKQIMIEKLLEKYGYNMGIYDSQTGNQFPSIEEEKEIIRSLKMQCK